MVRHLSTLIILGIFFLAAPAWANNNPATDTIGAIAAAEGPVTIGGQAVTVDTPLHRGDVIETGDNARALVLLEDDSQFTLGANASFSVDDYVFDAARPAANRARYSVLRGAFLYASGLMTKTAHPDVKIETHYASIGIRGTVVWGGPLDGEYGVLVQEGEVSVETDQGSLRLSPSQGTHMSGRNILPASPAPWNGDRMARAIAMISFSNQAAADAALKERKDRQQAARQMPVPQGTP